MERFLLRLKAEGLARIEVSLDGSTFVPMGVPDASRTRPAPYLGSKAVTALDKVPRYADAPTQRQQPIADPDDVRLIAAANEILEEHHKWPAILLDNRGSIVGAQKMLKIVPVDRAIPLLQQAVRFFNPSATDGEPLRSLGHPFITRYVINEYRRTQRDLAGGQLSMLFVERTSPPIHVYGGRDAVAPLDEVEKPEPPPATPEAITAGRAEFERLAAQRERPARG